MDLSELRRRCATRLQTLELPAPFDVRALCGVVAQQRGRPIVLHPMAGQGSLCGLWAETAAADLIFYEHETSPLHQEHIILHEVSHLLCGHQPVPLSAAEATRLLMPDLQAEMVRRVLGRSAYSAAEEQEAEVLASLILERVTLQPPAPAPPDPETAVLDRLASSLAADDGGGR